MAESSLEANKSDVQKTLKPGNVLPLVRGDSGYISPLSPETPISEHSTPSRTSFLPLDSGGSGASVRSSVASYSSGNSTSADSMAAVQRDSGRMRLVRQASTPVLEWERTPGDLDMLVQAFQCRRECHAHPSRQWGRCRHPHCLHIQQLRDHWTEGRCSYQACQRCQFFLQLLEMHSRQCQDQEACPVEGCRALAQRNRFLSTDAYVASNFPSLRRESSVQTDDIEVDRARPSFSPQQQQHGGESFFSGYKGRSPGSVGVAYSSWLHADSFPDDSLERERISHLAERIVSRLDQEEPLIPNLGSNAGNLHYTHSNSMEEPFYDSYQLKSLYPILEDRTPTYGNEARFSSFTSDSFGRGPMSSEMDGIITRGGGDAAPSMDGGTNSSLEAGNSLGGSNSLGGEEDDMNTYPHQTVKFPLNREVLTVNADDHYFRGRDYNANDSGARGGFGSICFCKDLATENMFAIKQNCESKDLYIDSIHKEASMLSRLGGNDHVIQMYGAVLDEEETEFSPPRVYKMMIELAEHGNLTNLLLDEQGCPSPLDTDQALYYFRQLLLGVKFLHENSVLHLDIKSLNLLIFNEGKTLKLCDFGTAIKMDDLATSGAHSHCMTPMFAAPEICRQEMPRFSADIWSCMCVLVEMLTALSPWHNKIRADSSQYSMMFGVGSYTDNVMETDLVPCAQSLDQEILDLMRLVFKADHRERSTAVELLKHRLIINAGEYEAMFDGCEDFEEDGMEGAEVHCCEEVQSSMNLSQPDECTGGNRDSSKRLSKDSGTGSDIEQDSLRGYTQKSLAAAGRTLDSGFGTPFPDRNIFISPCPEESERDLTDFTRDSDASVRVLRQHSCQNILSPAPQPDSYSFSSLQKLRPPVPNTLSVTWPGYQAPSSTSPCNSLAPIQQPCSCPVVGKSLASTTSPNLEGGFISGGRLLRHSNSAPAISIGHYRRHSLQPLYSLSGSSNQIMGHMSSCSRGQMRRSSSELYASSGPDIDSPEGRKKFLGMELDSPTHKEAASQTQDLDRQDSEEDDDVEKELPPITRSHPLSNSAPSTTDSHDVAVQAPGEVAGSVLSEDQSPSAVSAVNSKQLKTEEKSSNVASQSGQAREAEAARDQSNASGTVTTSVENRGTFYETIC